MKNSSLVTAAIAVSVALGAPASAQQAKPEAKTLYRPPNAVKVLPAEKSENLRFLDLDLNYVMMLWQGDFDNREQLQFDSDVGKRSMDTGGHLRVHSAIRKVDLPQFGKNVLYVEEYKNNDPTAIFRQRIYVLDKDEQEKAIKVTMHFFKDRKKWLGAHHNADVLKGITANDTQVLPGCEVFIRRDVDAFQGGMKTKTCVFGEDGKKRHSDYQVRLSKDAYWFRDRIMDFNTDQPLEQVADFSWHQLERARMFACMIDFPKTPGKPMMYTDKYIVMHDQGGTYFFDHPDGRKMVLTLRNNWSYGMYRETLVAVIQEGDEGGPTLTYGWAAPDAEWIGVNPGWMRVQCDLDSAKTRKEQQELRSDS
ncbi:MAG: chromophore lyase CpcT/CpeT [Rhodospirillaceae bacterium]|nr:chromophore lyase CpcT/CpeT [Rhodospirillaceae bacterium]